MARKSKSQNHGSDDKPGMRNNAFSSGPPAKEEYKIGPGRPPKEHQFKPGQSGNPKGAKRKAPSLIPALKDLERAFNQKVKVTRGEQEQSITMLAAGLQQFSIQFAKGDPHARRDAFRIAEKLGGSDFLTPKEAFDETLAGDRQTILDAYVARQTHRKVSAAPSPVFAPPELLDDDTPDEADEK
jgi:Family of unknown function (DUF5681)